MQEHSVEGEVDAETLCRIHLIVPTIAYRREYLLGEEDIVLKPLQWTIFELISKARQQGISQVQIGKSLSLDPKSVFYHLKQLSECGLIFKYPCIHQKITTNLWIHSRFADSFEDYLENQTSGEYSFRTFQFQDIAKILLTRPDHSMFMRDLAKEAGITKNELKRFRAKVRYFVYSGLLETFIATYSNGKPLFCVRLLNQQQEDQQQSSEGKGEEEFEMCIGLDCSLTNDLIRLGNLKKEGIFFKDVCSSLLLKRKAFESIVEKFSAVEPEEEDRSTLFVRISENIGKEHRKRLVLRPCFYQSIEQQQQSLQLPQDSENIATKKGRLEFLLRFVESKQIMEFDHEFYNDIVKGQESKFKMCRKTLRKDLLELEKQNCITIIPFIRYSFNGSCSNRLIICHSSVDLEDEQVKGRIAKLKEYKPQVHTCSPPAKHKRAYCEPLTGAIPLLPQQQPSAKKKPEASLKESCFWATQAKKYGYLPPIMHRARELHLYLWKAFSSEPFSIYQRIGQGNFPLSLYLKIVPITEEFTEILSMISSADFEGKLIADLSVNTRSSILNMKHKYRIESTMKILLMLKIVLPGDLADWHACNAALPLINPHNIQENAQTIQLKEEQDVLSYWTTLEYLCLKSGVSVQEAEDSQGLSTSLSSPFAFLTRKRSWQEAKSFSSHISEILDSHIDFEAKKTPYYDKLLVSYLEEQLEIPSSKIFSYFLRKEKEFKREIDNGHILEQHQQLEAATEEETRPFYSEESFELPEVYSKQENWSKGMDLFLMRASTILSEIFASTPLKGLKFKMISMLFPGEFSVSFLRHRTSLLAKYYPERVKSIRCNWQSIRQRLMDFVSPASRELSFCNFVSILKAYEEEFGKELDQDGQQHFEGTEQKKAKFILWKGSFEEFLNSSAKESLITSLASKATKTYSSMMDESLSFKFSKYLTQNLSLESSSFQVELQQNEPELLECMELIRRIAFSTATTNATSTELLSKLSKHHPKVIDESLSALAGIGTVKKPPFGRPVSQSLIQPSEKVRSAIAKTIKMTKTFTSLPNILGKKSEIDDFIVEDLLTLTVNGEVELRKFGANILISRLSAGSQGFSSFTPAKQIDCPAQLAKGKSWFFADETFNEQFFRTCKWTFLQRLSSIPGCTNEYLFSQLNYLLSWNDYCILKGFLLELKLILEKEENFLFLNLDKIDVL